MKRFHKLLSLLVALALVIGMIPMALAVGDNETEMDTEDGVTNEVPGGSGNNNTGDDNTGSGNTGSGNTGSGNVGDNETEMDPGDDNTGSGNTGDGNTGDDNTGSGNTGNDNTGDDNTGSGNAGDNETELDPDDGNTGNGNTGNGNTGDDNTGDDNTGDDNTGDDNTGDDNTGDDNTGDDEDEDEDDMPDWLDMTLVGSGYDFYDVTYADWFYEDVQYVCGEELMEGIGGDKFGPDNQATRAMIVTILWRMEGEPEAWTSENFSDIGTSRWYTTAVKWAASNGIVGGYGDGKFGPDDSITREQLAAILYRYAQYKGYDVNYWADLGLGSYGDAAAVSEYAVSALEWAVGAELVNGMGGNLNPAAFATRAQIAAIFHRFCEMY